MVDFLLLLQINDLDSVSKFAQVSIAILAYVGAGGTISGWYINYRLGKFEKELFARLDKMYVPREVCRYKHPEQDSGEFKTARDYD